MDDRAAGALKTARWASGEGSQTLVTAAPHPLLGPHVRLLAGYAEDRAGAQLWRELPHPGVVLVLSFGEPFAVGDADRPRAAVPAFVAGLHERWAMVASGGAAACVQANLTPLGALRLLGPQLAEVANRVVPAADVLGRQVEELTARLAETRHWGMRLALVQRFLVERIAAAPEPPAELALACATILRTSGAVRIEALARELGRSRKHLHQRFRDHLGLPPKRLARIARFDAAVGRSRRPVHAGWADLAASCGYADQAHLIREFRELGGITPPTLPERPAAMAELVAAG